MELIITAAVVNLSDGTVTYPPIVDGGPFQLVRGGQGFEMVPMNIRARNLDRCGVTITGQLFAPNGDPDFSNNRQATLTDTDGSGFVSLSANSVTDTVTLPPSRAGYGLWRLDAVVTDPEGHTADASVSFVMTCDPNNIFCACTQLQPPMPLCFSDAGTDGGTDGG